MWVGQAVTDWVYNSGQVPNRHLFLSLIWPAGHTKIVVRGQKHLLNNLMLIWGALLQQGFCQLAMMGLANTNLMTGYKMYFSKFEFGLWTTKSGHNWLQKKVGKIQFSTGVFDQRFVV